MSATRTRRRSSRLLRPASLCIAAIVSVVVPLALAEGVARLVGWKAEPPRALFRSLGTGQYYALAPGTRSQTPLEGLVRASNFGVRGPDVAAKAPGEKRIIVLGDSVAFGFNLAEELTFSSLLGQTYARSQPKADVVNASIAAWSRVQERMFLEQYGARLRPDLIVVTVIHNDLQELQVSEAELRVGVPLGNALSWLGARSALVAELKRRLRAWVTNPDRLATVQARMDNPTSPQVLAGLELEYRELDRIRELARAEGARVALVLFPYAFQLTKPESAVLEEAHLQYAREHNLPVLDLLPKLRDYDRDDIYLPGFTEQLRDEVHFNAKGHRVIADLIQQWIDDNGLLEGPNSAQDPTASLRRRGNRGRDADREQNAARASVQREARHQRKAARARRAAANAERRVDSTKPRFVEAQLSGGAPRTRRRPQPRTNTDSD